MADYFKRWVNVFLLLFPVMIALNIAHADPAWIFAAACLSIVPLAGLMGSSTEELADRAGSGVGGLLNATFGNAAEMIIAIVALQKGLVEVVKASLTGSIIGNLIFVLGLAFLVGGFKYKKQTFNRTAAGAGVTMMAVAIIGMLVPAIYHHSRGPNVPGSEIPNLETMSLVISGILISNYVCGLLFSLRTHREYYSGGNRVPDICEAEDYISARGPECIIHKPLWMPLSVLLGATACVAIASEALVATLEPVMKTLHLSELFAGTIIIAIIGNAAEHSTAVLMALRNKMDLAMQICIGSSLQIALFVTPALVFISFVMGKPMNLEFTLMEILSVIAAVFVVMSIAMDGESNWFEGAQLLSLYAMLGVAFYFI